MIDPGMYPGQPIDPVSPEPASQPVRSEYYERMLARSARRTQIGVAVSLAGGIACTTFLLANLPSDDQNASTSVVTTYENTRLESAENPEDTELTGKTPLTAETPTLPKYSRVAIHHVQFDGALSPSHPQRSLGDVQGGLQLLDNAHENTLGIAELPTVVSPGTFDLTAAGVSINSLCESDLGVDQKTLAMSNGILAELGKQTPIEDETLDVVVFDVEESRDCYDTPIGQATGSDIVIYKNAKSNERVIAHEINHNLGYGHDNLYETTPISSTTTKLGAANPWINYGNNNTIAGNGVLNETADPDPIGGYELLRNGVIKPEQLAVVEQGKTQEVNISALTNKTGGVRLVEMPLSPGSLDSADSIVLELSSEGANYSVKAYGAGSFDSPIGRLGGTYLIPLSEGDGRHGLDAGDLQKPITIDLAGGRETITLTLGKLAGQGEDTTATVKIARSA